MQKRFLIIIAAVVLVVACVLTFQLTSIAMRNKYEKAAIDEAAERSEPETEETAEKITEPVDDGGTDDFLDKLQTRARELDAYFRYYYIGDLDDDELIDWMLKGYIAGTGDSFGAYYTDAEYTSFMQDLVGEMYGIGVNVIYNENYGLIEVISLIPDGPAEAAGVLPGDLIAYVGTGEEQEYVADLGYYTAIDRVRGPEGTHAYFSVLRGENYEELIDFDVVRAKVQEVSVMSRVCEQDPSIGIIKVSEFDTMTVPQFTDAVASLQAAGCTKLIIDLRYNPGGELNAIVTVLDYILPEGPIVHVMDRDNQEVAAYHSEATELDMPMAILVNGRTVSAAELFTAALRDYNKAIIVGTTTYGKGCMQTTIPLRSGGAVSVTYRMYNPPFSENYHGVGIEPDIVVELDESLANKNIYKITDEEDNQLQAAIRALNGN